MTRRRYTEQEFRTAIDDPQVRTLADLCRALGLVPRGANYETLRVLGERLELDIAELLRSRRDRMGHTEREVALAVARSRSMAEAIRSLGEVPSGSSYRRLKAAVERLDLETSHWTGRSWATGRRFPDRVKPLAGYLVAGRRVPSTFLRRRLIAEGVKKHECEHCERSTWNGAPIPLELDHIDGDRLNNTLSNLRLLCPNCHAQTPTYRGRNIGRYG